MNGWFRLMITQSDSEKTDTIVVGRQ
jgi:hypothetical protein